MAKGGTITRKDLYTDDALKFGLKYEKNIKIAIEANEQLKKSALELNKISKNYKASKTEKEYLDIKNKEILVTKNIIKLEKQKQKAILLSKRIKGEQLDNERKLLLLQQKKDALKNKAIKKTIEERVQLQHANKVERQSTINKLNLGDAYAKLNRQRSIAQRKLANLLSANKLNESAIKRAQKQYYILDKRVKAVDRATKNYTKNIGNYKSALSGLTGVYRSLIQVAGVYGGTMAFLGVMKNGIGIVREFGATMSTLSGIYRVNRKDLSGLEDEIISVAGSSVNTANEVAKMAESLATLGKSKEEVALLLKPVNDLSIGLKASADESGEFLVAMLNTFGGSADEALKYADTIATIRTSTSLDFQKMRDSFQYLAPISKVLNKDLAYTGALVGLLADNGIKAERAGRLLGTAQQKLASEGKTLNDALVELNDAKAQGIEGTDLLAISTDLFGKQASALGVILADNTGKVEENAQAIRDNGGALNDLVNEQLKSLDVHLKILNSRWEKYVLNEDKATGATNQLKKGIKFLSDNLETIINTLIITVKWWVAYKLAVIASNTYTKIAIGLDKILAIGRLRNVRILKILIKKTKLYGLVTKLAMSPIGLLIAGIASSYFLLTRGIGSAIKQQKLLNKVFQHTKDLMESIKSDIEKEIDTRIALIDVTERELLTSAKNEKQRLAIQKKSANARISVVQDERNNIVNRMKDIGIEYARSISQQIGSTNTAYTKDLKLKLDLYADYLKKLSLKERQYKVASKELNVKEPIAPTVDNKKLLQDAYSLAKFKLEQQIKYNDEVVQNDKEALSQRIFFLEENAQKEDELARLKMEKALKDSGERARVFAETEEEKKAIIKKESDAKTLIIEQYNSDIYNITVNFNKKLDKLTSFDKAKFKKGVNDRLDASTIELNKELEETNNALRDKEITQEQHEQKIANIKKKYAKLGVQFQIDSIQQLLDASKLSKDVRAGFELELSNLKLQLSEIDTNTSEKTTSAEVEFEKRKKEKMVEIAYALQDLANTIFDSRIMHIDEEMQRSEDRYNHEIELAEGDASQQALLREEAERERLKLEAKKRKEQRKQYIFNKIIAVAEIAIQTAKSAAAAFAPPPVGLGPVFGASLLPYIIGLGAVQAGIVLATPIPAYAKGTKGTKKAEKALVGEVRPEIVIEPNKSPYMVSSASILDLPKGTEVIPSIKEYEDLVRMAILKQSIPQEKKQDNELINEIKGMRQELKALRKKNTIVHLPKIDINHAVWRQNQEEW